MKPAKSHILTVNGGSSSIKFALFEAGDSLQRILVRSAEAVALFCCQDKKWISAFAAALGGLDTLILAGGFGENAPLVCARVCGGLGFLGIELNEPRNADSAGVISTDASRVAVRVIHTDEELMIARSV
jgi:acetate kinase